MTERLMNLVHGFGSIMEIWPAPTTTDEASPDAATDLIRESWEDVGAALWEAIGATDLGSEEDVGSEESEKEGAESTATARDAG